MCRSNIDILVKHLSFITVFSVRIWVQELGQLNQSCVTRLRRLLRLFHDLDHAQQMHAKDH